MTIRFRSVLLFCLFVIPHLNAQDRPMTIFSYLTRAEKTELEMSLDVSNLLQLRKAAGYLPATFTDASGQVFPAEIRPRGKYRRLKCEIPPIKIKFSKEALLAANLDTLNEVKLVLPCRMDSFSHELVVREYLAYRMFEELSPNSFRARLIHLRLKDTGTGTVQTTIAVLVEHEEELLVRLGGRTVEEWGLKPERFEPNQAALMTVYQYMIGNTDWDLFAFRNVLLLQLKEQEKLMTIPYDFDFSGFVNAPYAIPNSQCGIGTVRDRFMMDTGQNKKAMQKAAATILAAKDRLDVICKHPFLSEMTTAEINQFMGIFYAAAGRRKSLPPVLKANTK